MGMITVDFESYYDKTLGFKTQTTEEYVRDERFEVIGLGIAVDDDDTVWFSGSDDEIKKFLAQYPWDSSLVLAHNTQFDGAILSWRYGINPKGWLDTLSMARALHGADAGGSLKALAERYGIGEKGTEVENAFGKRRKDFDAEALARYGEYCKNDVDLTRILFHRFMLPGIGEGFPEKELKVIDATLRMFINPTLELNLPLLEQHLETVKERKAKLVDAAGGVGRDVLMSNPKFAELLKGYGVRPPRKISATTGRETWAFAKNDEAFKALLEHENPDVQALVAARIGTKTTLEETRTERFINIAKRGCLPVPIRYYAAHTGRWGGDDKINLQNLPSRGQNANQLKKAIQAPDGFVIVDCDSAQIEARTVAWLAGQTDLVEFFQKNNEEILAGVPKSEYKYDPYKIMASMIYNKPVELVTDAERFVGKTTILGAGYGMGSKKFQAQLKTFGVDLPLEECERIIRTYRDAYSRIPELWWDGQRCIEAMIKAAGGGGQTTTFGTQPQAVFFDPRKMGFQLPSGLWQKYYGLYARVDSDGKREYAYPTRKGPVRIYGGKVVENICQAVARCVIAEQMLKITKRYRAVLTVHDAIACLVPEEEKEVGRKFIEECMRWRPEWAQTLPLNCESGMGKSYGDC